MYPPDLPDGKGLNVSQLWVVSKAGERFPDYKLSQSDDSRPRILIFLSQEG